MDIGVISIILTLLGIILAVARKVSIEVVVNVNPDETEVKVSGKA